MNIAFHREYPAELGFEPQHHRIVDLVGELGRERFAPRAAAVDRDAATPVENLRDLHDAGLSGITIRRELGGLGSGTLGDDPLLYLLVIEQLARYCLSTAQSFHIHCHGAHLVDNIANSEQRERLLRPVIERGALLNATASEPGRTARGLYGLATAARRVDGGYVLDGVKNYATLAREVEANIVFAKIADVELPDAHRGFIIPQGTRGFTIEPGSWNPLGMRGSVSPMLTLSGVHVPDRDVLGVPGVMIRDRWQAKFHLSFAQQYVGGCEQIFDILTEYLPRRGTAGDAYTQLRMGEIRVAIDAARWLVYRAAWLWKRKDVAAAEIFSMNAKYQAIQSAVTVMDKAAQIAGSSAFAADSPLSRVIRDLRVQTLHENSDKTAATIGKFHLGQAYDTTARL